MLHALAILYARWNQRDGDVSKTEEGLKGNVGKDFDWLESELQRSNGKFLLGDSVTAADVMMEFSLDFIITRQLGMEKCRWDKIATYLKACQATPTWQKAREKTGHKL